jgi:hypothetical protein
VTTPYMLIMHFDHFHSLYYSFSDRPAQPSFSFVFLNGIHHDHLIHYAHNVLQSYSINPKEG